MVVADKKKRTRKVQRTIQRSQNRVAAHNAQFICSVSDAPYQIEFFAALEKKLVTKKVAPRYCVVSNAAK
jgi:hypothetical protein